MNKSVLKNFLQLLLIFMVLGCSGIKTINFPDKIDTRSKTITMQERKIFTIEEMEIFATNKFLGARLNGFEKYNDSTVKIVIRPENKPINKSPYYSFKIWSEKPETIYLKFDYPEGYEHRYHPKIKKSGETWFRMNSDNLFKLADSTMVFRLKITKDATWVSAQEFVTSLDTEKWVSKLIEGKESYVKYRSVGRSTLGKNIPVLDIFKGKAENKEIVVLLTRHHPPEVSGFFAFKAFLTSILDDSILSDTFLKQYRVLAFPILNPDGVDLGHWRHNANGIDLNRDWSQYRQPEIKQVVEHTYKILKKDNGSIVLGLDFHSTYDDVFYTNLERQKTALPNFEDRWFKALENNISGYKVNEKPGLSTKPVSKGWFLAAHNAVGITYEIGDETPRDKITLIGKTSAIEMMRILTK